MHRIGINLFILPAIVLIAAACSGTSNTTRPPRAPQAETVSEKDALPEWFSAKSVIYDSSTVQAYAGAIAGDAAAAKTRAVARATTQLKQSISGRLETIRVETVQELGMESGLADAGFLIDLRKADSAVNVVVSAQQTDAIPVEGQNSVRGLAAVQLSKMELIKQLDQRMAAHANTWKTLKQSGAFREF